MDEPQPAQATPRDPLAFQVGQFDAVRVSHPDPGNGPSPVHERPHLPPDRAGNGRELPGELLGQERRRRQPPLAETLQDLPVAGLEARGFPFYPQGRAPLTASGETHVSAESGEAPG